ncbi:MAG: DUF5682 family protein, partial [Comamonas sp.]
MATSADLIHFFGIRHHGPGCARSLLQALEALQPDCLLVEGPPEGESLLPMLQSAELRPPVAMLVYMQDTPSQAAFYPFAEFSPEWQALQWASRNSVVTRFIDLPQTHAMAIELARREALKLAAEAEDDAGQAGELAVDESPEDTALEDAGAEDASEAEPTDAEVAAELPVEIHRDPLDWLAQAA